MSSNRPCMLGLAAPRWLAMTLFGLLAAGWCAGQPNNDDCIGALTIPCNGSGTTDNTDATEVPTDPLLPCRIGGAGSGVGTVWFKFAATAPSALLTTNNSIVDDTLLAVFSGNCNSLTMIGCDDDGGDGFWSRVRVDGLTIAQTYYVMASTYSSGDIRGDITVSITCPAPPLASNGSCATASVILTLPFNDTINNADFNADPPAGSCNAATATTMNNAAWWVWRPLASGQATLDVDAPDYDSIVVVSTGTCATLSELLCYDDPQPSQLIWNATRCATYYIQVGDWGAGEGGGETILTLNGPAGCPGDADGDNGVDQDDIDIVLFNYGTRPPPGTNGDLDCDGDVDQDDIDIVLFNYGTNC